MNFDDLRGYQRAEKLNSGLCMLPDDFYVEVGKYCKDLEANNEYDKLSNVLSIVNWIKINRLNKLFEKSLYYLHKPIDLDDVKEIPNILDLEAAAYIKILGSLYEYDHYVFSECPYLKKGD